MIEKKHIVISAGEASGDMHAAKLIQSLLINHPSWQISGLGGARMRAAGADVINDFASYGITGITEVIRHLRVIKEAFEAIKAHLIVTKPDLLVLIDNPGFNLRLAKFAKKTLGLRVLYYISPQIWAWKAKRIDIIRQYVDKMAVIFPFEKKIYQDAQIPVAFVGHPLRDKIPDTFNPKALRQQLSLPADKQIIALLPGSRTNEISRHMPIFIEAAQQLIQQLPDIHFVIPVASTISQQYLLSYFERTAISHTLISGQTINVVASSDCAVVASGTASLECALIGKPMCIVYKSSSLTYAAASQLMQVKYLGLCNLLQNKMIVPELLQDDCNADELTKVVINLLNNERLKTAIGKELALLKQALSTQQADCSVEQLIEQEMSETH